MWLFIKALLNCRCKQQKANPQWTVSPWGFQVRRNPWLKCTSRLFVFKRRGLSLWKFSLSVRRIKHKRWSVTAFIHFLPCTGFSQAQTCVISMYPVIYPRPFISSSAFRWFFRSRPYPEQKSSEIKTHTKKSSSAVVMVLMSLLRLEAC